MMMSPLNIISSTNDSSAASNVSRSPESVCSTKSTSPPISLGVPPPPGALLPGLLPGMMQDSKTAAAAASILHAAFASANGGIANPAAMAQLFPGFSGLQMAAAAAAFGYGGNSQGQSGPQQHPQNAYNLYAAHQQAAQQQQISSIIAAARQQQFLAMQSGKKMSDFEPTFVPPPPSSKLSPNSMHPPPPPSSHHLGHSPTSNGPYRSQHPLMPLQSMMAKGQSSPNNNSNHHPIVSSSNSSSSNSSSSASSQLLSPILFSPLSASSAASDAAAAVHYKRKLGLSSGPSEASDVPSSNAGSNADSAFSMANFQRMAASSRQSPPGPNSGPNSSTSGGPNICPLCNISLEGIDVNAHFYEEMHKIDNLRKMAEWSNSEESGSASDEAKSRAFKDGVSPYDKFGSSALTQAAGPNGSTSYQKKLQLPQSRWETFQRIRQNRHQRLTAFMRFTRRKYETAYESMAAAAAAANAGSQHSPLSASNPPSHMPPAAPLGGAVSNGSSFHQHHHSPSSSSTSSSSASAGQHRSPSSVANSTISPHHHPSHGGHPFDVSHPHGAFSGHSKVSPNSATSHQHSVESSSEVVGHLPRTSPGSLLPPPPNSAAYPAHHPMFAQNPAAFLHPGLPFYPSAYHAAAAAAAAAQLQSSPTAATGPWSMGASYPGFPGGEHFGAFGSAAPISSAVTGASNGAPKIWRSVDTDQLEAALSTTSDDVECLSKKCSEDSERAIKKMKKSNDEEPSDSIDVVNGCGSEQRTSRCSSQVSSSHGDQDRILDGDDSNDRRTPAVTAVSDDSNHSGSHHAINLQNKTKAKEESREMEEDDDEVHSNASSRAELAQDQHQSEAEDHMEDEHDRRSEHEEDDDVDVVSSDSESHQAPAPQHHPLKARISAKSSSPVQMDSFLHSKHRQHSYHLYNSHHNSHRNHHNEPAFHHFGSLVSHRSDSVGSATEAAPVS